MWPNGRYRSCQSLAFEETRRPSCRKRPTRGCAPVEHAQEVLIWEVWHGANGARSSWGVKARYRQLAAGKAVAGQFPSRPSSDPNRVRAAQDGRVNAGRLFAALLTLQSIS